MQSFRMVFTGCCFGKGAAGLRRLAVALLLATALLGAACSGKSKGLAPVKGKVMVGDQPVAAGHNISLIPISTDKGTAPQGTSFSAGQVKEDGTYEIFTGGKSGAPLGKYKVTISPSMVPVEGATKPPQTNFNQKYRTEATTTIVIEVVDDPAPGRYDLKLDK